jgi:hypothetical protein
MSDSDKSFLFIHFIFLSSDGKNSSSFGFSALAMRFGKIQMCYLCVGFSSMAHHLNRKTRIPEYINFAEF